MATPTPGQGKDGDDTIELTLTTTKTIGNADKIGGLVGVYQKTGASGDKVPFLFRGNVYATAKATLSWAKGDKVYYHATGTLFNKSTTNGTLAGFAAENKAVAAAAGWVHLCPVSA